MIVYSRICIKDYTIEAENGDRLELKRGTEYTTSGVRTVPSIITDDYDYPDEDFVIVFSRYWVPVPVNIFAGEIRR